MAQKRLEHITESLTEGLSGIKVVKAFTMENEEAARLSALVKVEREVIETRLMVGAILAYIVDNQQFPPKVRTMAEAYVTKATKVWQNRDRLDEILAAINNGEEPDLDAGWTVE